MPIIRLELLSGRTPEQKAALAEALTRETARIAKCPTTDVQIVFAEVAPTNWSIGGSMVGSSVGQSTSYTHPAQRNPATVTVVDYRSRVKWMFRKLTSLAKGLQVAVDVMVTIRIYSDARGKMSKKRWRWIEPDGWDFVQINDPYKFSPEWLVRRGVRFLSQAVG